MLVRWHYIALLLPLALLFLEWKRARPAVLIILFGAIVMAAAQGVVDTRVRVIRSESIVPISSLPRETPLRRRFGLLHGLSSLLLLGQALAAAAVIIVDDER
jgi:hypothetical protein